MWYCQCLSLYATQKILPGDTWLHHRPLYKTGLALAALLWEPHGGFMHTEMRSAERKPFILLRLLCTDFAGTFPSLHIHTFIHKGKENPGVCHPQQIKSAAGEIKRREASFVQLECIPSGQQRNTKPKEKHAWLYPVCLAGPLDGQQSSTGDWSEQEGNIWRNSPEAGAALFPTVRSTSEETNAQRMKVDSEKMMSAWVQCDHALTCAWETSASLVVSWSCICTPHLESLLYR